MASPVSMGEPDPFVLQIALPAGYYGALIAMAAEEGRTPSAVVQDLVHDRWLTVGVHPPPQPSARGTDGHA